MLSYFVQEFIHPYVGLNNFQPELLPDLEITPEDKEYLKQYLLFNVFFHNYEDQWKNLGLAYFTARNYFESNDDFIIVDDPDRSLYVKAITFINENFSGLQLRIPLVYEIPSKQLIISSYEDIFDKSKVYNTVVYLLLKYAKMNIPTVTFDVQQSETVGFYGGQ